MAEDDLDGVHDFDDADNTALFQALRASGTPAELADEERYLAMFRAASAPAEVGAAVATVTPLLRHKRAVSRAGAGSALAVAIALATGGVAAAAYTNHLPAPLQTAAHNLTEPLPVAAAPAPIRRKPKPVEVAPPPVVPSTTPSTTPSVTPSTAPAPGGSVTPSGSPGTPPNPTHSPSTQATHLPSGQPTHHPTHSPSVSPSTSPSATPTASPSASPSTTPTPTAGPTATPTVSPSPTDLPTPSPTGAPTPTPTPTPQPTPTVSTPPTPVVTAVSIDGSATRVDVGQVLTVSGVAGQSDGTGAAGVEVVLEQGGPGDWTPVATATSDSSGYVSFDTPPADATTRYRLESGSADSSPWRVAMHPLVFASSSVSSGQVLLHASSQGGYGGDAVTLLTWQSGSLTTVGSGALDADGNVTFAVAPTRRHTTYVVVLAATDEHTESRATIQVDADPGSAH